MVEPAPLHCRLPNRARRPGPAPRATHAPYQSANDPRCADPGTTHQVAGTLNYRILEPEWPEKLSYASDLSQRLRQLCRQDACAPAVTWAAPVAWEASRCSLRTTKRWMYNRSHESVGLSNSRSAGPLGLWFGRIYCGYWDRRPSRGCRCSWWTARGGCGHGDCSRRPTLWGVLRCWHLQRGPWCMSASGLGDCGAGRVSYGGLGR